MRSDDLLQAGDHRQIGDDCNYKENNQELSGLLLKDIFLLLGKKNYSDELTLESGEVSSSDTDRNSIGLAVWFELGHLFPGVDLDYRCSFKDEGRLVNMVRSRTVVFHQICFLDDGNRLSGQGTLVDESAALEDDALEGNLDSIF